MHVYMWMVGWCEGACARKLPLEEHDCSFMLNTLNNGADLYFTRLDLVAVNEFERNLQWLQLLSGSSTTGSFE